VSDLRASDEDRDRAAAEIRAHFADGRLTEDELNDRIDAVYSARTHGQLAELRADLPALPPSRIQARAELAERKRRLRGEVIQETGGAFVPFVICTAIWAFSGAEGDFWPVWLLLLPVIAFARNFWRLYGPGADLDELEAELAEKRRESGGRRGR
jgi:hypothetical protein